MAILDAKAQEMYVAWKVEARRLNLDWNPFVGERVKQKSWDQLSNHEREVWREKALKVLRSDETLADELKREERERRAKLSERGA